MESMTNIENDVYDNVGELAVRSIKNVFYETMADQIYDVLDTELDAEISKCLEKIVSIGDFEIQTRELLKIIDGIFECDFSKYEMVMISKCIKTLKKDTQNIEINRKLLQQLKKYLIHNQSKSPYIGFLVIIIEQESELQEVANQYYIDFLTWLESNMYVFYYNDDFSKIFNNGEGGIVTQKDVYKIFGIYYSKNLNTNNFLDIMFFQYLATHGTQDEYQLMLDKIEDGYSIGYLYVQFAHEDKMRDIDSKTISKKIDVLLGSANQILKQEYEESKDHIFREEGGQGITQVHSKTIQNIIEKILYITKGTEQEIEDYSEKLAIFTSRTQAFKQSEYEVVLEDIENTQSIIKSGDEVLNDSRLLETIQSTILKNYGNGELAKYLLNEFEESLKNSNTSVFCVEYEGELAAFCRIEQDKNGGAYIASLNIVENAKGANIARLTMVHIMKERYPDIVMTAHSYPEQVALPMYLELGFVAKGVERLPDGDKLLLLERNPQKTYEAVEYIDIESSKEIRPVFDTQAKMGMILIKIEKYEGGQRLWFAQK